MNNAPLDVMSDHGFRWLTKLQSQAWVAQVNYEGYQRAHMEVGEPDIDRIASDDSVNGEDEEVDTEVDEEDTDTLYFGR